MKKILLFTDSLGAGGAQRQLVGLALFLKEAGYNIKVCTYFNYDFYKKNLDEKQIPNELIPQADNKKKRIWAVHKYFQKENPNWVIAYQETPSLITCLAKMFGGKFHVIVSERNTTQKIRLNEHFRFFLYKWADFIVPNSYSQEKFLTTNYPWMSPKIKTITNFVDTNKFYPKNHQRHNIPEILVVGSISNSKNTKGFLNACRILKEKNIKFHATWYGWHETPTQYMLETKELISAFNLENIIELKRKTLDIAPIYREADYFCIPSFFEGTPNVLCEAIASGLAVISSNVCDNPLYAQNGINGYLFNPTNIDSMVSAIEHSLSIDEKKYQLFCKNSRNIAEKKLSSKTFLSNYISIIENKI